MQEHQLTGTDERYWRVSGYEGIAGAGSEAAHSFFAGNDIITIGCMLASNERGYEIPRDISIIGMDDLRICEFCTPKLTTIRVFRRNMAIAAVRTLLSLACKMTEGSI